MKRIKQKESKRYRFDRQYGEYRSTLDECKQTAFDPKGRRIKEMHIDKRAKTTTRYIYEYCGENLLKELIYNPVHRISGEIMCKYDKQGRLRYSKLEYKKSGVSWENYYTYEAKGRRKEWLHRWYSGDDDFCYHYTYNKSDRLVREESWSKLCGHARYDYKYDDLGNITEETSFMKKDNSANCRTIYSYNKKGLRIRTDYENLTSGSKGYSTYEYDKKGTLLFEKYQDDDDEDFAIYDRRGNLLLRKNYQNGRLTSTDTYEYNKYGHLIRNYVVIYDCNCMGVKEVPLTLEVYNYKYY